MSSIITGILNSTIGLLWNKARDSTAEKLQHGDVTDAKIREIVVRELNDIKTKLDGLSRKDLLSSCRFVKEGVELLNACLDQSTHLTQEDRGESLTMSSDVASTIFNEVLELTRAIGKVKIKSCTEFELAKERFKDARKKATEAFCNEALGIDDRIFAAKLRVISEILENLESPKATITGCLSFLRDLHSLPAIREIFSVYLTGGVKSLFRKEERAANVKSVMLINYVLFQFTFKFGGKLADRLNWPAGTIELTDRTFNPVTEWRQVSLKKSMGKELGKRPNELILDEEIYPRASAVDNHGEIIVKHTRDDEIKIISRSTGETKVVKLPEPREGKVVGYIEALAVDNNNDVHVVLSRRRCFRKRKETDVTITYELHVLDDGYNVKHVERLDFLEKKIGYEIINIAINKNNDTIMIRDGDPSVYVCDNSGKLKRKFERDSCFNRNLSISNKNEILIPSDDDKAVDFYTEEGNLTSTLKLPEGHEVRGIAIHYVLGKIIVLTCVERKKSYVLCYSEAGKLESSTFVCKYEDSWSVSITSHPGGPVAVVREKSITYI